MVQIGAKPDSGSDDPLGMLKDCHRRIEHFLEILCVVAERACNRSLTEEESLAVKVALKYFHAGGERHTRDEEESLSPRLLAAAPDGTAKVLERLERDHGVATDLHSSIDWLYTRWTATGSLDADEHAALLVKTSTLKHLYAGYILCEETVIFPRAAQILNKHSITEMGREFSSRRK